MKCKVEVGEVKDIDLDVEPRVKAGVAVTYPGRKFLAPKYPTKVSIQYPDALYTSRHSSLNADQSVGL